MTNEMYQQANMVAEVFCEELEEKQEKFLNNLHDKLSAANDNNMQEDI